MPWAFIVDLFLALIPLADASALGYGWLAIMVYWSVLSLLRTGDHWVIAKTWRPWTRVALRVAVIGAAELAVMMGAGQVCDAAAANCHPMFSPVILGILTLVAFGAAVAFSMHLRQRVQQGKS